MRGGVNGLLFRTIVRGGVTGVVVCNAPEAIRLPCSSVDTVVSSGNLSTHSSSMEGGCSGLGCVFGHERNRMISHLVGAGARDDVSGWCCGNHSTYELLRHLLPGGKTSKTDFQLSSRSSPLSYGGQLMPKNTPSIETADDSVTTWWPPLFVFFLVRCGSYRSFSMARWYSPSSNTICGRAYVHAVSGRGEQ